MTRGSTTATRRESHPPIAPVDAALQNPAAYDERRRQAWRKLTRRVVCTRRTPGIGTSSTIGYNLKLAYVGICVGGLWDSCPRYWEALVATDNKLMYTQWVVVVELLVKSRDF